MKPPALDYLDSLWQRVSAEIPSRHFPPHLQQQLIGCRRALADFAMRSTSPVRYLEVGCRLGHSLAITALAAAQPLIATVVDLWIADYGDEPNPGPAAVHAHLLRLGLDTTQARVKYLRGDSHAILPALAEHSRTLILVDGDHTVEGARDDLIVCFRLLATGGKLVFDDAVPELLAVWRDVVCTYYPNIRCTEHLNEPPGVPPWCEATLISEE